MADPDAEPRSYWAAKVADMWRSSPNTREFLETYGFYPLVWALDRLTETEADSG